MTLNEYLPTFYGRLARAGARPGTIRGYACVLEKHIAPPLGEHELAALSHVEIRPVLDQLSDRYSTQMAKMIVCALRALFKWAKRDHHVEEDPTRDTRTVPWLARRAKRPPRAFAPPELDKLIAAAKVLCPQFVLLFLLLSRTGLRIGEALALRAQHFDLRERWVYVEGTYHGAGDTGDPKTSAGFRYVDLSDDAADVLTEIQQTLRDTPGGWLFPGEGKNPYHARTVQQAFSRCRYYAQLGYCTPHTLRHTFASWLIATGVSVAHVKDQMGHASIQTTVDLYGSWFRLRDPGSANQIDRVARGEFGTRLHRPPSGPERDPGPVRAGGRFATRTPPRRDGHTAGRPPRHQR